MISPERRFPVQAGFSWFKLTGWQRLSLLLPLCLLVLFLSGCGNLAANPGANPSGQTPPATDKWLGGFSRVPGTRFLYAQISSTKDPGLFSLSSGYDTNSTHNFVFFDPTTTQVTRLLPNNDQAILSTTSLPESENSTAMNPAPLQVQWFLYSIAKQDTNNDQKLTNADHKVLAIADAGGQKYTELIDQVDQLYGQTLSATNTLHLIYRKTGRLWSSTVNLQTRQVTETKPFPGLGNDLKLAG
jgi:hypothetical protein